MYFNPILLHLGVGLTVTGLLVVLRQLFDPPPMYVSGVGFDAVGIIANFLLGGFAALLVVGVAFPLFIRWLVSRKGELAEPALQEYARKLSWARVYRYGDNANAFAVPGTVVLGKGLDALTLEQRKGILTHELAHVKHWDTLRFLGVSMLMTQVMMFGPIVMIYLAHGLGAGVDVLYPVLHVSKGAAFLSVFLVLFWYMRKREYAADAYALLQGAGSDLAHALDRLSYDHKTGRVKSWLNRVLSTHPPAYRRIERLGGVLGRVEA